MYERINDSNRSISATQFSLLKIKRKKKNSNRKEKCVMEFDANHFYSVYLVCFFSTNSDYVTFEFPDSRLQCACLVNSYVKMSYCMLYKNTSLHHCGSGDEPLDLSDQQKHDDSVRMKKASLRYAYGCGLAKAMVG